MRPRSLAVVGASPEPLSLGGNVLANIERFGFAGDLHLVSRTRSEINGRACVATIDDLPQGVDAVVLMIPVPAVKEAIAACVRRGVGGAIVYASGFGELGEEGQRAQDEIAAIAREAGFAMLGPNCLGLINFVDQVPLTFEPVQPVVPSGPGICAIAQSGAMAGNIRMALLGGNVPVAYTVSTGNEAVLGAEDVIEGLLDDPAVQLFSVFVEQIRHPKRFLNARCRGAPARQAHRPDAPRPQRALARGGEVAHRRARRRPCGDARLRCGRGGGAGREPGRTVRRQPLADPLSASARRRRRHHEQFRRDPRSSHSISASRSNCRCQSLPQQRAPN